MSDMMSITDMLARLRADAASEQFEGARLGPIAVRELLRHVDSLVAELRRERDELAARLAEIEAQEPVAWIEHELQGTGLRHLHFERRPNTLRDEVVDPVWTELIARPAPAAAPERAAYLDADIIEAQRAVVQQLASRPVCNWAGQCRHQRQATADAPELAEPADPRTPPPGCRLLGDYEPAQAGDMAYIGAIGGRWRPVRPRMGIIGATMDELSDGARVLALARPCRCGPDGCADRVSCPRGER